MDDVPVPAKGEQFETGNLVPHPHRLVGTRRCQTAAVGAEGDAHDSAGMPDERDKLPWGSPELPDPDGLVPTGEGQPRPIQAEGKTTNPVAVARQRELLLPRRGVQNLDLA